MKLSCSYNFQPKKRTCNTSYVQTIFGIDFEQGLNVIARDVEVDYEPGRIVLFVGPSGSGKSSLLRAASARASQAVVLDDICLGDDSLIDSLCVDVKQAAHLLSLCGLGEAALMLRSPNELSDGQRYRYAVAKCLAGDKRTVVADEWCAKLDRITAKVVSSNIRRIADRGRVGFLLATTHDDIIEDLQPDSIVYCRGAGVVEVEKRRPFRRRCSVFGELEITKGAVSDWAHFAGWHYRGHGLGPVRKVLVLWLGDDPVGICVFGFGPLSSSGRNRMFGFSGKLTKARADSINRNFASVSRLVVDPRFRGAGIASTFLRRCCELTDWPWIELVSEMADIVPFYRSAGFRKVGSGEDRVCDIDRVAGRRSGRGPRDAGHWGKSGWTEDGFDNYKRRSRFSRPVYLIRDNRSFASNRS